MPDSHEHPFGPVPGVGHIRKPEEMPFQQTLSELANIRDHLDRQGKAIAVQGESIRAMQQTQSDLVTAMKDLVRVDTQIQQIDKSLTAAWDTIRENRKEFDKEVHRNNDKRADMIWKVAGLSGTVSAIASVLGMSFFGG